MNVFGVFRCIAETKSIPFYRMSACAMIGQLNVNVMKNTVHTINIISSETHVTSNK